MIRDAAPMQPFYYLIRKILCSRSGKVYPHSTTYASCITRKSFALDPFSFREQRNFFIYIYDDSCRFLGSDSSCVTCSGNRVYGREFGRSAENVARNAAIFPFLVPTRLSWDFRRFPQSISRQLTILGNGRDGVVITVNPSGTG